MPTKKTITLRRILETVITATVIGLAIFFAVMLVIGKMSASEFAIIIQALRGGG